MFAFRKKIVYAFILLAIFASCKKNEKSKNAEDNKTISTESAETSRNGRKKVEHKSHPIGEPYVLGITPDDYNMDYDTSRLKKFEDKKSKYYPKEGVKGIYLNTYITSDAEAFENLIDLVDSTDLNTVVVDIKDNYGNILTSYNTDNKDILFATNAVIDADQFIDAMHKKGIYVIGRIPTFKDSVITKKHPERGFTKSDGSLWTNDAGEAYVNPFSEDVREYMLEIAKLAAESDFDEIQFDYIRFAEGFETFENELKYSKGEWKYSPLTEGEQRIDAITSFVKRAREELQDYNIPVGVDVFGYAMQVGRAEGIGQDFAEMANQADVMSSMIYPSHRSDYSFEVEKPDLEPYELVKRYLKEEQEIFSQLDYKPQSRPWIQDFTASRLGEGNYMVYDKDAVEAQIDAIYEAGQKEFLIWNALGEYSQGVDY